MTTRNKLAIGAIVLIAAIVALAGTLAGRSESEPKPELALMTSLPIMWGESDDFGDVLSGEGSNHRVRILLEQRFVLVPLDTLADDEGAVPSDALKDQAALIVAQPRALAPADFAALDQWVRDGGNALIFADPLLTEESHFGFGDPRRPEAVALLSPIFSRWGLRQLFDETQGGGVRLVSFGESAIPVEQAGRFELLGEGAADCALKAEGLIADCSVGEGRAFVVADAALLDGNVARGDYDSALQILLDTALAKR